MITYQHTNMVKADHIKVINKSLKKMGSKVQEDCLDGENHSLANILHLACGGGTYRISIENINSISNDEFNINCSCINSIRPR